MGQPRAHVLVAELGDDLRARGGLVAQDAGDPGPAARTRRSARTGKPSGKRANGLLQDDAHQLPVAGDGVLAAATARPCAPRRPAAPAPAATPWTGTMFPRPSFARLGRCSPPQPLGDVGQGVGPLVAVGGGVGQAADADGVQDDQEDAVDLGLGHPLKQLAQGRTIVKGGPERRGPT